MIGLIVIAAYIPLLIKLMTSKVRRKWIVVPLVSVMYPAGCIVGTEGYDRIQGARATARATRLKEDVDRRFPIGTEQDVLNRNLSEWLSENDRHTSGWYYPSWWRFSDDAYAYRDDDTLMLLLGKLPSPTFGCGRMKLYLRMRYTDHKLASTEIYRERPDCL